MTLNTAEWAAPRQTLGSVPAYVTQPERAGTGWVRVAITVLDMPWLLTPDSGVSARYPRPLEPLTHATERLYALGIDAGGAPSGRAQYPGLWLDGVSGRLQPGPGRRGPAPPVAKLAYGSVGWMSKL